MHFSRWPESSWQDTADDDKIMQVKDVHVFKRFLQANDVHFGLILPLKPFFFRKMFLAVCQLHVFYYHQCLSVEVMKIFGTLHTLNSDALQLKTTERL